MWDSPICFKDSTGVRDSHIEFTDKKIVGSPTSKPSISEILNETVSKSDMKTILTEFADSYAQIISMSLICRRITAG